MQFKPKPPVSYNSKRAAIGVERHVYEQVETIAFAEHCSMQEAASRLLEAGIAVYHAGKEQAAGDE